VIIHGARALGWRLRRHGLDPVAGTTVADVVHRVIALRGWPAELADLAVCVRQVAPDPGGLAGALDSGELVRSYAFRGGSYAFGYDDAADLLSVRGATRVWETRRYQQQGDFVLDDWEPFRAAVREILADGPRTRAEIAAHLRRIPDLRHLATGAGGAGADSLYKPLHWWGDICFGPSRDGVATYRLLRTDPRWPGLPEVDEAGPRAIRRYLEAYGPATADNLRYWLTEGLGVPRRRVSAWVHELGDELTEITQDGVTAHVRTVDLDELRAAEPSDAVRLVPGFDPWVLGPGTADRRVIADDRRGLATRGASLVISGGVVSGTWRIRQRELSVAWFDEAGPVPVTALRGEVGRLADIRGTELDLTLT
jgi:winged helix DNA-binding protein